MKNEIEQQIFEKMKAKDFGESMCNETKLNVLKWTMQQLRKHENRYLQAGWTDLHPITVPTFDVNPLQTIIQPPSQ